MQMSKPSRSFPRPLSDLTGAALSDTLKSQGFASAEIIARWAEIAGPKSPRTASRSRSPGRAARRGDGGTRHPGAAGRRARRHWKSSTSSAVILERVNRFFGWQAVGRIALRQAPLRRRDKPAAPPPPDPAVAARIAEGLPIEDEDLRQALGRLGAAIKRK